VIATPTTAVVEFWGRGTHTGPLETPKGTIPPTGRRVEWQLCFVYDVHHGKVHHVREYFDAATLMAQLGA
jgi:predicted ester cyclase